MVYNKSTGSWREVGMDPPTSAPGVAIGKTPSYYVARIDIEDEGTGYNRPPAIEIERPGGGFSSTRTVILDTTTITAPAEPISGQARASARVRNGRVSEITVTEYGKGYAKTPCVRIYDSGATGSGGEVNVEQEEGSAPGDFKTGIVYWEVIQTGDKYPCWPANTTSGSGKDWACTTNAVGGTGSGAKVRITLPNEGATAFNCTLDAQKPPPPPNFYKVEVDSFGSGYEPTDEVTVEIPFATSGNWTIGWNFQSFSPNDCGSGCGMVIKGYPLGHPKCPDIRTINEASRFRARKIKQVSVIKPGLQYLKAPEVTLLPYPGAPPSLATGIKTDTNCSGELAKAETPDDEPYLIPPQADTVKAGGAKALAVVRATLRGKYQCYYRFVNDSISEEEGGPLYSNLSPVTEVDCGDAASKLTWSIPSASGQATAVELWRTTSNQATTLFRVAKLGGKDSFGSAVDDLSDWELLDPDRKGFLAMPILLPNGELNANRFGVPPSTFSVGVMFQDRMWLAVDTTGKAPNTLMFSEADEPESMPDINELIIQSNLRSTDYITALIPYAGALVVCQARHCHRLTYVAQPLIDAAIYLLAYRGCINQRCWDIYEGKVYAMDDQGVYSMDAQGNVESLTVGIDDFWVDRIDMSLREWFMVRADRRLNVLRVNVACKEDGATKYPTRQLVYSFDYKSWWEERYPTELTAGAECRTSEGQLALVYGTSRGAMRQVSAGLTDIADSAITKVVITNPGRGYKQPPAVRATGGHGAEFEVGINTDGEITGIVVKQPGTGYSSGALQIDPPPAGGVQAVASAVVADGKLPVHWFFRSGCFEYTNDSQDKRGGEQQSRHCSVTYQPTKSKCELQLQGYYNNAKYPRSNVVRRDRGTGFVHSDEVPAAVLDMQATPLQEVESHCVARALFAGRVLDDMMGTDRHISIALSGKQDDAGPVAIHSVDVFGVNQKGDK
jgi:hypothetical protein